MRATVDPYFAILHTVAETVSRSLDVNEVLRTAHRGMEKIVNDKGYQDTLLTMGFTIDGPGSPESIRKLVLERRAYWKQVFDGLGVKPE